MADPPTTDAQRQSRSTVSARTPDDHSSSHADRAASLKSVLDETVAALRVAATRECEPDSGQAGGNSFAATANPFDDYDFSDDETGLSPPGGPSAYADAYMRFSIGSFRSRAADGTEHGQVGLTGAAARNIMHDGAYTSSPGATTGDLNVGVATESVHGRGSGSEHLRFASARAGVAGMQRLSGSSLTQSISSQAAELDAAPTSVVFARSGDLRSAGSIRLSDLASAHGAGPLGNASTASPGRVPVVPKSTAMSAEARSALRPQLSSSQMSAASRPAPDEPRRAMSISSITSAVGAALAQAAARSTSPPPAASAAPDSIAPSDAPAHGRGLPALPSAGALVQQVVRAPSTDALKREEASTPGARLLQQQLRESQQARALLHSEMVSLRADLERTCADADKLRAELASVAADSQAASAHYESDKRSTADLLRISEERAKAAIAARQHAEQALSELRSQHEAVATAHETLQSIRQRLEAQLAGANDRIAQTDAERKAFAKQVEDMSAQNAQFVGMIVELRSRLAELTARSDALELQQETRDVAHESEQKALITKVTMYEQQIAGLRRDLQDSAQRAATTEAALGAANLEWERRLAAEIERTRLEVASSCDARLTETRAHFDELVAKARAEGDAKLLSQRNEYELRVSAVNQELARAQEEKQRTLSSLAAAESTINELQTRLALDTAALQQQITALRDENAAAVQRATQINRAHSASRSELSHLHEQVRSATDALRQARTELVDAQNASLAAQRDTVQLQQVVSSLEAKNLQLQRRIVDLERDLRLALARAAKLASGANLVPLKVQAVLKRHVREVSPTPLRASSVPLAIESSAAVTDGVDGGSAAHPESRVQGLTSDTSAAGPAANIDVSSAEVVAKFDALQTSFTARTAEQELQEFEAAMSPSVPGALAAGATAAANEREERQIENEGDAPADPKRRSRSALGRRFLSRRFHLEAHRQKHRSLSPGWQHTLRQEHDPAAWLTTLTQVGAKVRATSPEHHQSVAQLVAALTMVPAPETGALDHVARERPTRPQVLGARLRTAQDARQVPLPNAVAVVEIDPVALRRPRTSGPPASALSPVAAKSAASHGSLQAALQAARTGLDAMREARAKAERERNEAQAQAEKYRASLQTMQQRLAAYREQRDSVRHLAGRLQADGVHMFRRLLAVIRPLALRLSELGEEAEVDPAILMLPQCMLEEISCGTDAAAEDAAFKIAHAHLMSPPRMSITAQAATSPTPVSSGQQGHQRTTPRPMGRSAGRSTDVLRPTIRSPVSRMQHVSAKPSPRTAPSLSSALVGRATTQPLTHAASGRGARSHVRGGDQSLTPIAKDRGVADGSTEAWVGQLLSEVATLRAELQQLKTTHPTSAESPAPPHTDPLGWPSKDHANEPDLVRFVQANAPAELVLAAPAVASSSTSRLEGATYAAEAHPALDSGADNVVAPEFQRVFSNEAAPVASADSILEDAQHLVSNARSARRDFSGDNAENLIIAPAQALRSQISPRNAPSPASASGMHRTSSASTAGAVEVSAAPKRMARGSSRSLAGTPPSRAPTGADQTAALAASLREVQAFAEDRIAASLAVAAVAQPQRTSEPPGDRTAGLASPSAHMPSMTSDVLADGSFPTVAAVDEFGY